VHDDVGVSEYGRGSGKSDPIDVQLGVMLREIRLSRGLAQAQLTKKLGLSFQQIQKYELGRNRVTVSTLLRLCQALRISAATIVDDLTESPAQPAVEEPRSLSAARALVNLKSEPIRTAVIALLKAVEAEAGGSRLVNHSD
jgi:transcriptional regulator with XRE-family HTH domain